MSKVKKLNPNTKPEGIIAPEDVKPKHDSEIISEIENFLAKKPEDTQPISGILFAAFGVPTADSPSELSCYEDGSISPTMMLHLAGYLIDEANKLAQSNRFVMVDRANPEQIFNLIL